MIPLSAPCPCGRDAAYGECCAPLLLGSAQAETAEQLMRSRFTAFVVGDEEHLWRTWHPRTRPSSVGAGGIRWTGLTILDAIDGGREDATGQVEFVAAYVGGRLHERSRFERRAGRWFYVDGDLFED